MRNGCAFVARRPGAQVIAVIVGGEPGDADREWPAPRVKIAPDSTPTGEPEELIAADARPEGDGKPMALLKVAAGLVVLPFDNVCEREAIAVIGDCWPSSKPSQRAARSIGPGTGLATSSDPAAGLIRFSQATGLRNHPPTG
jgi:hypothetical protein